MSRLIDADKLIDDMKNELEKAVNDENMDKADCMVIMTSAIALKDFVNRQPTSFDVDKVVEQLDNLRKEYETEANNINTPPNYTCYYKGHMRGYEHSIDIVKRGGIDEEINRC